MQRNAAQLFRMLTAMLIMAAFTLLPLMTHVGAEPLHMGLRISQAQLSDCPHASTQPDKTVADQVMSEEGQAGDCHHTPLQKTACCLGTFCPAVQMMEGAGIDMPKPDATRAPQPFARAAFGQSMRPAPIPRPPRQFV